jgi:hypothetical protein
LKEEVIEEDDVLTHDARRATQMHNNENQLIVWWDKIHKLLINA